MKIYAYDDHWIAANDKDEAVAEYEKVFHGIDDADPIPDHHDLFEVEEDDLKFQNVHDEDTGQTMSMYDYLQKTEVPHYVCDNRS